MIPNKILRLAENYDGNYDNYHYVERVFKTMKIFNTIIDMTKVPNYSLKSKRKELE